MREVLIRFDDNKVAEKFVQILDAIQNGEMATGPDWELHLSGILASHAVLDALIARPTMGCKYKTKQVGWRNDTNKFGWFICPTCKRPNVYVVRHWLRNIVLGSGGKNLLPDLLAKLRSSGEADATEDQTVQQSS